MAHRFFIFQRGTNFLTKRFIFSYKHFSLERPLYKLVQKNRIKRLLYRIILLLYIIGPISLFAKIDKDLKCDYIIGLKVGLKTGNFDEINDNIKEYYELDGIDRLPTLGLDATFIKNRLLFNTGIFSGDKKLEEKYNPKYPMAVSAQNLNVNFSLGWLHHNTENKMVYPYIGFHFDHLRIKTNFSIEPLCSDCFFRSKRNYSVHDWSFLFGISLIRMLKNGGPLKLLFGIDTAIFKTITDNKWDLDGETIEPRIGNYIPKCDDSGIMVKLNLGIVFTNN